MIATALSEDMGAPDAAPPWRGGMFEAVEAQAFVWTQALSVHDELIDEQHRRFIDLANRLEQASLGEDGAETAFPIFLELIRYVHHHFEHEEAAMRREGYPAYVEHKLEHEAVLREIGRLGDTVRSELELFCIIGRLLPAWLFRHILNSDQRFGHYLANQRRAKGC